MNFVTHRSLLIVSALTGILVLEQLLDLRVEAQGNLHLLQLPFTGTYRINSYVDHQTPLEVGNNPIVIFNGEEYNNCPEASTQWTVQGPYCYDGHEGIDWAIDENIRILSSAAGTVIEINSDEKLSPYGRYVRIDHGNGYITRYAHLNAIFVQANDGVKAGDQIGLSGNTGNSSGPHLHFDVAHNGQVTDPFGWRGSSPDPLIDYSGEAAVCLWANEWCNETIVEDGDVNHAGTAVKFIQVGSGWRWVSQGNSWTMKYVANGDGSTVGYWIPFLTHSGPHEVFAFIPDFPDKTTVNYTIHDQNSEYTRSVNQAAYADRWIIALRQKQVVCPTPANGNASKSKLTRCSPMPTIPLRWCFTVMWIGR